MATKKTTKRPPAHAAKRKPPARAGQNRPPARAQSRGSSNAAEALRHRSQVVAVVLFAVSILLACLVLIPGDHVWRLAHDVVLGLFGFLSILWPILLGYVSVLLAMGKSKRPRAGLKIVMMAILILLLCGTVYIFQFGSAQGETPFGSRLANLYELGKQVQSPGWFGGLIGTPFVAILGATGGKIVSILLLFVLVMLFTRTTLMQLFSAVAAPPRKVRDTIQDVRERRQEEQALWDEGLEDEVQIDIPLDAAPRERPARPAKESSKKNEKLERLEQAFRQPDPTLEQQTDALPWEKPVESKPAPQAPAAPAAPSEPEPGSAAAAAAAFMERSRAAQEMPAQPEPAAKEETFAAPPTTAAEPTEEYRFPPVSLLKASEKVNQGDITGERADAGGHPEKLRGTDENPRHQPRPRRDAV